MIGWLGWLWVNSCKMPENSFVEVIHASKYNAKKEYYTWYRQWLVCFAPT